MIKKNGLMGKYRIITRCEKTLLTNFEKSMLVNKQSKAKKKKKTQDVEYVAIAHSFLHLT